MRLLLVSNLNQVWLSFVVAHLFPMSFSLTQHFLLNLLNLSFNQMICFLKSSDYLFKNVAN